MWNFNDKRVYAIYVLFVLVSNLQRGRQKKVRQKGFRVEGVGRSRVIRRFASFFSFLPIFKICDKSFSWPCGRTRAVLLARFAMRVPKTPWQ